MGLRRPWKVIKIILLAQRINLKLSITDIWFICSWTWWGLHNFLRQYVSGPHYLRATTQLEKFSCYLTWTCFAVDIEKALFSSLFNFSVWRQMYFLSFLFFILNNPYLFNIFSEVIFSSFLTILLLSSGTCLVGQNPSSVMVPQTREKTLRVLRRTKEPRCMLYK